ncbi:MAG TPA: hypothetical protein VLZ75_05720 [Chitinophagales bacterium]|nr:hypothetical protein [Chitinophagales bacterium]
MKYIKLLFLLTILVIVSCKKDSNDVDVDFGYEYIADQKGAYVIYHVDSTIYNDFTQEVTRTSLEIKEFIVEDFTDNLGRSAQRVERYKRAIGDTEWELFRTYYIVKGKRNAERIDENLRYVNFVFPPKENITWKGNRFIDAKDNNKFLDKWEYRFTSVDVPQTIKGIDYPETATILLRDNETVIEKVFAKETYAKGIGMVYKEWWHLETQKNFDKPWEEKAEKGFILKMYAIEHGME